ncbi:MULTISPECIES: undecaprenyldiphospho-muramoylpentapeptide beta-N-acetylglucosaminyltransferase [Paenibacillus]|uniref:undecaprenyldiphospho-muramoylpentapeptide beta-N-acetylglucosaminyltransferase n=1 Tax=Paenibacillus TaxID=44249 RepID=UPI000381B4DF|nr:MULTISPECIES: undecaprenyldiphospho-muramoylpentapeptide beta-N-acetylglucosaminyltransferase [Paenibacillus]
MRVILTGGGTGGHIYPALAIAEQFKEQGIKAEFLYIGGKRGLETRIVPETKMRFETIDITGFRRRLFSLENIKTINRFIQGVKISKKLIREFKPDIVIGTGGYVCGPVVYAAAKLGIPTMVHEQNAIPGLTNLFLSGYADTVAVSFEEAISKFKRAKHVLFTGNPRATMVQHADRERGLASLGLPADARVVLMVGGSRGARALVEAMVQAAPLLKSKPDVHYVFVTGEIYYDEIYERINQATDSMPNYLHVLPYIPNMPEVLAATSLVIGRAGASSLAEITSLGTPSLLIPSPNVTNNHQEANALALRKAGAAEMILERELNGATLIAHIDKIMDHEEERQRMSEAASTLGTPQSAFLLVEEIQRICNASVVTQ